MVTEAVSSEIIPWHRVSQWAATVQVQLSL